MATTEYPAYEINKSDVNISNYYFPAQSRWSKPPCNEPQTMEEAQKQIDQLYAAGVPFFTKEMIQSAFDQCQRKPRRGEVIFLKDITGALVEFECQTGDVEGEFSRDGVRCEYLLLDPVIWYDCRAHLKHHLCIEGMRKDRPPFCALTIQHPSLKFKSETKEPVNPWPTLPRDQVAQTFQTHLLEWRESEVARRLVQILTAHAAGHQITKIVGLALGAISWTAEDRPRSHIQHALLVILRDWLANRDGGDEDVVCYAQDPAYRCVDHDVLKEHGIEVIDDPRAWLEIDNASLVFSVSPNVPVKEIVADLARPAIVIWERVGFRDGDEEGKSPSTDPSSSRVRAMLEQYELFDFGAEADDNFCHTVMYVRRCRG